MNCAKIGALGIVVAWASAAPAAVLDQRSLIVDRSANIFSTTRFDLDFDGAASFFDAAPVATLFDALEISPADVGATFTATEANDPGFADVAAWLTDARDEVLVVVFRELASGRAEKRGFNESLFFAAGGQWPQFGNAKIEEFRLTVDRFSLDFGPAPLAAGGAPQVDLHLTLTIMGRPVPEPGGLALLALACGWGLTLRRAGRRGR